MEPLWESSSRWLPMSTTSLTSAATSTRAISASTVFITIEADEECERTPLLAGQWRAGGYPTSIPSSSSSSQTTINSGNFVRNYGGLDVDASNPNVQNVDRRRLNSFGSDYSTISSYTSTYYYEAKTHLCDLRLFAITFILIVGFTIATYLLIADSRQPTTGFTLDLVTHELWSKLAIPLATPLNHTNVANVLIGHTASESCDSPLSCSQVLSQLQKLYTNGTAQPYELPFNFLVADDGQTYEVRGWDNPSGLATAMPQNSSIVIGFLGNFTTAPPNAVPLQSAISLIKESVRRKKLQQNYQIYGIRNVTANENDAEALFHYVTHWSQFQKIINIF